MQKKFFLILWAAVWSAASPLVELTIQERAGIARANEPVTLGVPLPEGLITDTAQLALTDPAGNAIPCEFRGAMEWINNTSLRWVHLDFKATVAESGAVKVVLHSDPSKHAPQGQTLVVTDLGTKFEVATGKIKFTVKKGGYNLLDEVFLSPAGNGNYSEPVIATHTKGLMANSGGMDYASANDAAGTTVIERKGPLALVLKSTGFLKNSGGTSLLRYVSRIYAYSNSSYLKVVYTFENSLTAVGDSTVVKSLTVELPTVLSSNPTFYLGAPGTDKTGSLASPTAEAYCLASNPWDIGKSGTTAVNYNFGGLASGSGECIATKVRRLGWAALSNGTKAMAFAVRDFWQTNPKSVEVSGDGLCRIGLYPLRRNGGDYGDLTLYGGIARTHEMRFVFAGGDNGAALQAQIGGMQKPLMAFAPPAWYCSQTRASGRVIERDYNQYQAAYKMWVQGADARTNSSFNNHLIFIDKRTREGVTLDGYGILDWGDVLHWAWTVGLYSPDNVSWDGQYYDTPHHFFKEFLRTGDPRWFDAFEAHSRSMMDVDMGHFGPGNTNTGACRYNPARDHVKQDEGNLYVSGECNHHKNQGLFERYYLCGDDRSLEVALETVTWAATHYPTDYRNPGQIRGPAHYCNMMMEAYLFTKQASYLTKVANTVNYHIDYFNSNGKSLGVFSQFDWMGSLFNEAVVDYYEVQPTAKVAAFLKDASDRVAAWSDVRWVLTHSINYKITGQTSYLDRAVEDIKVMPSSFGNMPKDFVQDTRSLSHGLFYFGNPSVISVEAPLRAAPVTGLSAYPNPFTPQVSIAVPAGKRPERVEIFTLDGRRVDRLDLRPGQSTLKWAPKQLPCGVYIVQWAGGGRTLRTRVSYLK